jgi:hypothetical protein
MPTEIKAIVFKTPRLQSTKEFYAKKLGLVIKEYSATHFVIHSKGIRLLFVDGEPDFEVALYVRKNLSASEENKLILHSMRGNSRLSNDVDPNGIKITIAQELTGKNNHQDQKYN